MSELSLLIHHQNQVQIDLHFLQQCQNQKDSNSKDQTQTGLNKLLTAKQIHLNKIKSRHSIKTHSSLQKSILNLFPSTNKSGPTPHLSTATTTSSQSQKQHLTKITLRIDALEQNRKRLEQRMGAEMFYIKEELEKECKEQYEQVEEVKRIRSSLVESKRKIGELLALIMVEGS